MLTTLTLPGHSLPVPSEGPLWPCPLLPGRRLRLRLAILARVAFDRDPVPGDGEEPRPALALDPDRDLLLKVFEEYPRGTRWFGELVDRHWDRTWACCMSVLLNPQDAEEAVQDAFLKAHRYLPSFRSEARFGTWMLRIARRVALDALAGRRRADDALGRIGRAPNRRRRWSPAPAADPAARERDLLELLERLDPVDRLVLVLHDLNGVPFDEIAETLEAAPAAVRMRASRARARAREPQADGLERTMNDRGPDRSEAHEDVLAPEDLDVLNRTLRPRKGRDVEGAIEEVERDIALEDILIVLMDSAATAAKEFFDMLIQVVAPQADRADGDPVEKEHHDE